LFRKSSFDLSAYWILVALAVYPLIRLDQVGAVRPPNVFGTPMYCRDDQVISLGNPSLPALLATMTNVYADFGTIAGAALDMIAARRGVTLAAQDRQQILGGIRTLPPHPEVAASLARLRAAGLRLAALTNSTAQVAEAQLTNAGLAGYFEQILSADMVQRLKPAPEPYRMAAARMGVQVGAVRLVAAHAWDIAGALRAGCAAAFIARPGKELDPLVEPPDVIGADLREVADRILAVELGARDRAASG
jgi:2-haloacid dehalogenase